MSQQVIKTFPAIVKLIIFCVVTSLATGVLAMTIMNGSFRADHQYTALFTDVTGLLKGDDVRIAGVRVGQVRNVDLVRRDGRALARVTFTVMRSRELPKSVQVVMRYRNLIGQRYIALHQGAGSAERLPPGGVIPLEQTQPALDLTTLFNGFRPLFRALNPAQVNRLSWEIIQVLQGEAGTIKGLLGHVASLTNSLADRDAVIGRLITNLNTVLGTIDARDRQFSRLLSDLEMLISGLAEDRKAIGESLVGIKELTGVTGSLLADARPALKADIEQLGLVAQTLARHDRLLTDILDRQPTKLAKLNRFVSYGSWTNMYLCAFDVKYALPGQPAQYTPLLINQNERCHL